MVAATGAPTHVGSTGTTGTTGDANTTDSPTGQLQAGASTASGSSLLIGVAVACAGGFLLLVLVVTIAVVVTRKRRSARSSTVQTAVPMETLDSHGELAADKQNSGSAEESVRSGFVLFARFSRMQQS